VKARDNWFDQEVVKVSVVKSFAPRVTGNSSGREMTMTEDSSSELKKDQMIYDDLSELKIIEDWFGAEKVVKGNNLSDPEGKVTAGWSAKKVRGNWSAPEMRSEMTKSGFD